MIYGYARVSTGAQDLTSQLAQLKAAGCEKVFREKLTGTTADRPQLRKLIKALAPGDAVIIPAVDRLSRDTTDLLIIAREMQKAGAGIRSLAEPFLDTTSDFAARSIPRLRHPNCCSPGLPPAQKSPRKPVQWHFVLSGTQAQRRAVSPTPRPSQSLSGVTNSSERTRTNPLGLLFITNSPLSPLGDWAVLAL